MAEEEVIMEVEAVQSVYEDDCLVLEKYPPHLHVHIKPRTADVSSQQVPTPFSSSLYMDMYMIIFFECDDFDLFSILGFEKIHHN